MHIHLIIKKANYLFNNNFRKKKQNTSSESSEKIKWIKKKVEFD